MYHTSYNKTNLTSWKPDPILSTSSKFSWLVFGLNYIYCTTCLYHFEQSNYIKTVYLMFHQIPKTKTNWKIQSSGSCREILDCSHLFDRNLARWNTLSLFKQTATAQVNLFLLQISKNWWFYTGLTMINSRNTS